MRLDKGSLLRRTTAGAVLAALAFSGLPHTASAETNNTHRCHPPAAADQPSVTAPTSDQHCPAQHGIACATMPGCAGLAAALLLGSPEQVPKPDSHPLPLGEVSNLKDRTSSGPPTPPPDLQ
ncbi:MAG: hypothetical protein KatS3mg081_1578 [Gemmatimonadales bacterium]|nr:hypothetical protein HRbin33_00790 [bacterium HR33]GIW52223.1 MAG: hypothetical protein KatS3mg081_1578 [Gemmatimonadales bacterium]